MHIVLSSTYTVLMQPSMQDMMIAIYYVIVTLLQYNLVQGIPIDGLASPTSNNVPDNVMYPAQPFLPTHHSLASQFAARSSLNAWHTDILGSGLSARFASSTSIPSAEFHGGSDQQKVGPQGYIKQDDHQPISQQKLEQPSNNQQNNNRQATQQQDYGQQSPDQPYNKLYNKPGYNEQRNRKLPFNELRYSSQPTVSPLATSLPSAGSPFKAESSRRGSQEANAQVGPATEFTPPWNHRQLSCYNLGLLDGPQQWNRTNSSSLLQRFKDYYDSNKLLCAQCYGNISAQCSDPDELCQKGLHDLARPGLTNSSLTNDSRMDTALGKFAGFVGSDSLVCRVGKDGCGNPGCQSSLLADALPLVQSFINVRGSFNQIWEAIGLARDESAPQMKMFASKFAPVQEIKKKLKSTQIWLVFGGVIAGLLTGFVGWGMMAEGLSIAAVMGSQMSIDGAAGVGVGLGGEAAMDKLLFDQPEEPDVSSALVRIVNISQNAIEDSLEQLMAHGAYTYSTGKGKANVTVPLDNFIENGILVKGPADKTSDMKNYYKRFLMQQLAVFTWQNLEPGESGHLPFIAFDPQPCDQLHPHDPGALSKIIENVTQSDTNITYEGACYFLLDAQTHKMKHSEAHYPTGQTGSRYCLGKANKAGTNKEMAENVEFNMTLSDIIIPAVRGWRNNSKQNDYETKVELDRPIDDILEAGVVRLPVCDYVGNPKMPGVNCPRIGGLNQQDENHKDCPVWDLSFGENVPGDFKEGKCSVQLSQWRKNFKDENELDHYQLALNILDADRRIIGSATKQKAEHTLEVANTVLPYDLFVIPGGHDKRGHDNENYDKDPVRFWYADQYWLSNETSHNCREGGYEGAVRRLDCEFDCNKPGEQDEPANLALSLPDIPVIAVPGNKIQTNVYESKAIKPTALPPPPPNPPPEDFKKMLGKNCRVHVRQYKRNVEGKDSLNDTPDSKIEVAFHTDSDKNKESHLIDAKGKNHKDQLIDGPHSVLPAPAGKEIEIPGMLKKFTVKCKDKEDDHLTFTYGEDTWDSGGEDNKKHACKEGKYGKDHRDISCDFACQKT